MLGGGNRDYDRRTTYCPGSPRSAAGLRPRRPDHRDRRRAREGLADPDADQRLEGPPARADGRCAAPTRSQIGPVRPQNDQTAPTGSASRLSGESLSAPEAVWASTRLIGDVSKQIVASLDEPRARQGAQGHLERRSGSSRARRMRSARGPVSFLWVLGLISLSLALLNLLPLLPLDGGHIAFSIVEGIRGRPPCARGLRARLDGRDRARPGALLHRPVERPRRRIGRQARIHR